MPNIITHGLFAQTVLSQIKKEEIKNCIKKYPSEYIIGSNGPDFLFFYRFFDSKGASVRQYGSLLHSSHINDFYRIALEEIDHQQDPNLKEAMISYVAGHLCHWALDSRAHPYIFYRTGNCKGQSALMHHRFESMLDAMVLKLLLHKTIKEYNYDRLTNRSKMSVSAIAHIYVPILKKLFDAQVDEKTIAKALKDWQRLNELLHDPTQLKTKLVEKYEKKTQKPWLFKGYIVPIEIDETYDVLNNAHQMWCYPCDNFKTSKESFMDIFHRAVQLAVSCIESMDDASKLCDLLNDESYDTGTNDHKEMIYFDLIYGDEHENI